MKDILNKTDFKAGQALIQDGLTGDSLWLIGVKATFDISESGELSISEEQAEIVTAPEFRDEKNQSSLLYENDMVLKPKIDLLLNATCYAPEEERTTTILAGIQMGQWSKFLKVSGTRDWVRVMGLLTQTSPRPFQQIPITYERAYGGIDDLSKDQDFEIRNPIGKGYARKQSHLNEMFLPNIEYPDFPTRKRPKKNKVAGFGAISDYWQPRMTYAGTYDQKWEETRQPLLPMDFNPLFYQCAPEDQIFDVIHQGDYIRLTNLCRLNPKLDFVIPSITFECATSIAGQKETQTSKLQTMIIEPDYPRLIMLWMNVAHCTGLEDKLEYAKINQHIISI